MDPATCELLDCFAYSYGRALFGNGFALAAVWAIYCRLYGSSDHLFKGQNERNQPLIFCDLSATYWPCLWREFCLNAIPELSFYLCREWVNFTLRTLSKTCFTFLLFETINETFDPFSFFDFDWMIVSFGKHLSDRINVVSTDSF